MRDKHKPAFEMYVQGKTLPEISKLLSVDRSTISRWRKQYMGTEWDWDVAQRRGVPKPPENVVNIESAPSIKAAKSPEAFAQVIEVNYASKYDREESARRVALKCYTAIQNCGIKELPGLVKAWAAADERLAEVMPMTPLQYAQLGDKLGFTPAQVVFAIKSMRGRTG